MCGFTGFITKKSFDTESVEDIWRSTNSMFHRGPDAGGIWYDQDAGVALGHRRLSVLDLTTAGHQPMQSFSGRYVIVYNGEIYNFITLRAELDKISIHQWRGQSDTEVILAAIEEGGIERALKRFIGMFAFALWDKKERVLTLARDRIGEKPLYYGWCGDTFLFASELKALKAYPAFNADINRNAIAIYLRHNCIPAPHTIYKGIHKLIPGTTVTISKKSTERQHPEPAEYWSARMVAEKGLKDPFTGTEQDAVIALEEILRDAVGKQMVADVPLGAFLSGGIDSSMIVAMMQQQSTHPVKTFTIGYADKDYNEAINAREVARHLGTDHTELYVSPAEAREVIPRLPSIYDEPFADSSQIPTLLVSQLARNYVTVSLSGDAGDELFGGYNRYFWWQKIWDKIAPWPQFIRKGTASTFKLFAPNISDSIYNFLMSILPGSFRQRIMKDKLQKVIGVLDAENPMEMYISFCSHWHNPADIVVNAQEPSSPLSDRNKWLHTHEDTFQMMYLDLVSYLPDDILVKVDRAAMSVSLETRMPFLDHRLVEFAWKLPLNMKIRNGQGKWMLRQLLFQYVPRELIERPKTGFGIPIDAWLRGPLRDWANDLLDESRLRQEGYFLTVPIQRIWTEHLTGKRNWSCHLWDVLMFQAWLNEQKAPL